LEYQYNNLKQIYKIVLFCHENDIGNQINPESVGEPASFLLYQAIFGLFRVSGGADDSADSRALTARMGPLTFDSR
jgi:hypothetical protein